MYQWVESIWIKDGNAPLIDFHQRRYEQTLYAFSDNATPIKIKDCIEVDEIQKGEFKCRFLYNNDNFDIEFLPYTRKKINKVKIIQTSPDLEYTFKWLERNQLDLCYSLREGADEIIMVRNNFITDAYYFNLVFEKEGSYFTPDTPLLNGVMRQSLIANKILSPISIKINDLDQFDKIHLINALNPIGNYTLDIDQILR